jgi:thioredoxin 1
MVTAPHATPTSRAWPNYSESVNAQTRREWANPLFSVMQAINERATSAMNMKRTIDINESNFENEVLKSSQPVLIEFATGWSLPSMMLGGALDEIAVEFVDCLKVARVKLDRSPNLGLWYGIRCLPTILYFSDGEVRIGIFGTTSKEAILSQLKPVISSRRMPEQ